MKNQIEKINQTPATPTSFFSRDDVKRKFAEILGESGPSFIASILQCVSSSDQLKKCNPLSIYNAASLAATLRLPIQNNLGHAYIIPYNVRKQDGSIEVNAQFQIGYKGLIQLCHRSGEFTRINVTDVKSGEIKSFDHMTGDIAFEWIQDVDQRKKQPCVGYLAYFRLSNGFEKSLYMTINEIKDHGRKYSKTFSNKSGRWELDFDGMAKKTVLKLLLSKFAPQSIEITKAITNDQAVFNSNGDINYSDNATMITPYDVAKEKERNMIIKHIQQSKKVDELITVQKHLDPNDEEIIEMYETRLSDLMSS